MSKIILDDTMVAPVQASPGKGEAWTPAMVTARLAAALEVVRGFRSDAPSGVAAAWMDVAADAMDWADADAVPRPALPSAAEIDRAEVALGWLAWLKPDLRKLVSARAAGLSWRKVGRLCGWSHTHAEAKYTKAVRAIVARLNGCGVFVGQEGGS